MATQEIKLDFDDICLGWITGPAFKTEEIIEKRKFIMESMQLKVRQQITLENFNKVLNADALNYLFSLYDHIFFDNQITGILEKNGCILQICFDNMCTKTAGKCSYKNNCKRMIIKLATKVFQNALKSDKIRLNAGIPCKGLLNCLLLTFEHELTHALIGCFCFKYGHSSVIEDLKPESKRHLFDGPFKDSNGHSKVFMTIVNKKYGHTKHTHNLFNHEELPDKYEFLVNEKNTKENVKKMLKPGMDITFFAGKDEQGIDKILTAKILKLNLKKIKAIQLIESKKRLWEIPYRLIIKNKSESDLSDSANSNNKPLIKPTPKPVKKSSNSNNKPLIKPTPKPVKKSSNSNNNKPIVRPKTVKKPHTPIKFKVKPSNNRKGTWSKIHINKYLMGIPKEYKEKYGNEKITDLKIAIQRCVELGDKCSGITKGKKYYSLRAGKILKDSTTNEISWLKIN